MFEQISNEGFCHLLHQREALSGVLVYIHHFCSHLKLPIRPVVSPFHDGGITNAKLRAPLLFVMVMLTPAGVIHEMEFSASRVIRIVSSLLS